MSITRRKFIQKTSMATGAIIPSLAFGMASHEEFEFHKNPLIEKLIYDWTMLAKFTTKPTSVVFGPWWAGIRYRSLRWYVDRYIRANGDFPYGAHRIRCTYGPHRPCDVFVGYMAGNGRLDEDFIFPEQEELHQLKLVRNQSRQAVKSTLSTPGNRQ